MLSFASLAYADAADRVGFGLGAWLDRSGGLFSLTNNAGLISLSITNNTASLLTGTLRVASYVNASSIASPAPEPETYAMLLLGLAVVGATARRRSVTRA
ncbi:PEP-CTERM sorting domain-containing protein [Piscinibacter aquaticus]|uniref:PEP-CTERM sorting domain-containing protein n=1 Tax=Piscinibacter aquaticus TaxID=392597 RepID=A0A5C6U6Q0_9BURK|nr:PEP-CTERM sorting domain-containing protein [Piscinibacter aquaticus]